MSAFQAVRIRDHAKHGFLLEGRDGAGNESTGSHLAVPEADPLSVVRFLIEQQNLTQRDLIPQFGSESAVSMFMTGQRNLTLEQVRKLSARFKLPADVFIPKVAVTHSPKRLAKAHSRSR
jgi:hypothetical protein